jgi:hypothetical protein
MNEIENFEAESITVLAVAADGGTKCIEVKVNGDHHSLYIDGRVGSKTTGEIYYLSPHEDNARMMPKDTPLATSIKKLNTEQTAGENASRPTP